MKINKIVIAQECYDKIMYWTRKANGEVGGLLHFDDDLKIINAYLLPQEVSGASVDINAIDVSKWVSGNEALAPYIKGIWHSHSSMGVFFSGQDNTTGNAMAIQIKYFFSLVVNKKGEHCLKLYLHYPLKMEIEMKLEVEKSEISHPEWDAEFERNVKERRFEIVNYRSPFLSEYKERTKILQSSILDDCIVMGGE